MFAKKLIRRTSGNACSLPISPLCLILMHPPSIRHSRAFLSFSHRLPSHLEKPVVILRLPDFRLHLSWYLRLPGECQLLELDMRIQRPAMTNMISGNSEQDIVARISAYESFIYSI